MQEGNQKKIKKFFSPAGASKFSGKKGECLQKSAQNRRRLWYNAGSAPTGPSVKREARQC